MSEGDVSFVDPSVVEAPPEPPQVEPVEEPEPPSGIPDNDLPPEPKGEPEPEPPPQAAKPETQAKEVSRMLRELREAHPDKANLLKAVQDAFFRASAYGQHYPTPDEALRAKTTFEALGGDEGIATLQQSAERIRELDTMAETGDPKLIEAWRSESPEGFKKAAPAFLDALEKMDLHTFQETLRPHLIRSLEASGLQNALQRISYLAGQSNNDMLKQEVAGVSDWLKQLNETEQRRQQTLNDPRNQQLEQQRQQLSTERSTLFNDKVAGQVHPYLSSSIIKSIDSYAGGRTLPQATKDAIVGDVTQEINRILGADKVYQSNMAALRASGDVDKVAKYIKSNIDAIRARAVREVWNKRVAPFQAPPKPAATKPAAPAPNGQAPKPVQSQALKLPAKPDGKDIDWDRDPSRLLFMTGKAYLKSGPNAGKLVSWR